MTTIERNDGELAGLHRKTIFSIFKVRVKCYAPHLSGLRTRLLHRGGKGVKYLQGKQK